MSSSDNLDTLVAMGFPVEDARTALSRFNNDVMRAVNALTGNEVLDDEPRPLVDADDPPPYGPQPLNAFEPTWTDNAKGFSFTPPPKTPTAMIDLTGSDDDVPTTINLGASRQDDDLAKGLALSLQADSALSREENDVNKAMEASVLSLGSNDPGVAIGAGQDWAVSQDAIDRVRVPNHPVILRSTSHYFSTVTAYLQCLFALPSARAAILSYRPTMEELPGYVSLETDFWSPRTLYEDYWKGEGSGFPTNSIRHASQVQTLFAIQRLFALMELTKRSFILITDVERALDIDEAGFRWGSSWQGSLRALHEKTVDAFQLCTKERLIYDVSHSTVSAEDFDRLLSRSTRIFSSVGREVANNQFLSAPLPAVSEEEQANNSATIFNVGIYTHSSSPDTLYAALDRLLTVNRTESFSLLNALPDTLTIEFNHLEDPGAEAGNFHPLKLEEELWLDRYAVKNRREIKKVRERLEEVRKEVGDGSAVRSALVVTKDGKDAIELLETTVDYFRTANAEDPARAEKQKSLARQYEGILQKTKDKLAEYDEDLARLEQEAAAAFDTLNMRAMGPYRLSGLIMRTGVYGPGSAWSYVLGSDRRWWKIMGLTQEEVTIETILADDTGIRCDAGVTMAFYQLDTKHSDLAAEVSEPPEVPPLLRRSILWDNTQLAHDLPDALTADWERCPPEDEDEIFPNSDSSDDGLLHLTRPPPPSSVRFEDILLAVKAADQEMSEKPESKGFPVSVGVVPREESDEADLMVVDLEEIGGVGEGEGEMGEIPDEGEEGLASVLRGGGPEGGVEPEEDEEEEEYEGEEEDEVELGCLVPMPDEWDIDRAVGKVGGLPRWLDPTTPLEHEQVKCEVCGTAMRLLLQLNSPDDQRPHAAARTLYVFACRRKRCRDKAPKATVKGWRVQMASPNPFYPHTPESEARRKALEDAMEPETRLAGERPNDAKPLGPLKEWDIECESEPYEESFLTGDTAKAGEGEAGGKSDEDEAEPDTATGVDKAFLIFQERVERVPEQVLRFYRLPGVEEPEPLWVSSARITPEQVPVCSLCGGRRKVEFQILSTLLAYAKDEDDLQFDSLLVYTCAENCRIPDGEGGKSGWAEEVVVEQSFAVDGVRFGGPPQ